MTTKAAAREDGGSLFRGGKTGWTGEDGNSGKEQKDRKNGTATNTPVAKMPQKCTTVSAKPMPITEKSITFAPKFNISGATHLLPTSPIRASASCVSKTYTRLVPNLEEDTAAIQLPRNEHMLCSRIRFGANGRRKKRLRGAGLNPILAQRTKRE